MLLKTLFATDFYSDRFNYAIVCEDEKKSSIYPFFCLLKYHDPLQYWEQFRERAGENEGRKSTLWYWAVNYVYINKEATKYGRNVLII